MMTCIEWDTKAESLGIDLRKWGAAADAQKLIGVPRPFGPSKYGSPRCESGAVAAGGHRTYCTCDTCF